MTSSKRHRPPEFFDRGAVAAATPALLSGHPELHRFRVRDGGFATRNVAAVSASALTAIFVGSGQPAADRASQFIASVVDGASSAAVSPAATRDVAIESLIAKHFALMPKPRGYSQACSDMETEARDVLAAYQRFLREIDPGSLLVRGVRGRADGRHVVETTIESASLDRSYDVEWVVDLGAVREKILDVQVDGKSLGTGD
jgi:hypothetical protein